MLKHALFKESDLSTPEKGIVPNRENKNNSVLDDLEQELNDGFITFKKDLLSRESKEKITGKMHAAT